MQTPWQKRRATFIMRKHNKHDKLLESIATKLLLLKRNKTFWAEAYYCVS